MIYQLYFIIKVFKALVKNLDIEGRFLNMNLKGQRFSTCKFFSLVCLFSVFFDLT